MALISQFSSSTNRPSAFRPIWSIARDGRFGALALELPFDVAFERDQAVADRDLDMLRRVRKLALESIGGVARDLRVGMLLERRELDLDVVRKAADAFDLLGLAFGFILLAVAADEAGQGDDPVLHGHADVGRVDVGVPAQRRFHVALDVSVGLHGVSPSQAERHQNSRARAFP